LPVVGGFCEQKQHNRFRDMGASENNQFVNTLPSMHKRKGGKTLSERRFLTAGAGGKNKMGCNHETVNLRR